MKYRFSLILIDESNEIKYFRRSMSSSESKIDKY